MISKVTFIVGCEATRMLISWAYHASATYARRLLILFAIGGVLTNVTIGVKAGEPISSGICELIPGLQGRIESINVNPGVKGPLQLERGSRSYPVKAGCLVIAGDVPPSTRDDGNHKLA